MVFGFGGRRVSGYEDEMSVETCWVLLLIFYEDRFGFSLFVFFV